MRARGYKCSNSKCDGCVGGAVCGEPFDSALHCLDRSVWQQTNADRIRAMSDEELADNFMAFFAAVMNHNNEQNWSFADGFRDNVLQALRQPVKDGEGNG